MSLPAGEGQSPRPAREGDSTGLEGKLRDLILGHGSPPSNRPDSSGSTSNPRPHLASHMKIAQKSAKPDALQGDYSGPEGTPSRGASSRSRGRSKKSRPKAPEAIGSNDVTTTFHSSTNTPLAFSVKPARRPQRPQASKPAQPPTDSSIAAAPSAEPLNPTSGQSAQIPAPLQRTQVYRSGHRQTRAQERHPNSPRPPHAASQGHVPFHTYPNPQRGNHHRPNQDQAYGRPLPQHQQLYNPNSGSMQAHQQPWSHRPGLNSHPASPVAIQAQISYLDAIVREEVPKVMISQDEEQEKASVRTALEDVCQRVITEHEIVKDALFDGRTISLQCYGSIRTGFATQSSDMDLVLQSPRSKPEVSSAESDIPRLLEKALLDLGYGARLLTRTRIPLIRFCEKPTPELATRLHDERQRWEKEKDAPPKVIPPKAKKTKETAREDRPPDPKDKKDLTDRTAHEDGFPQNGEISDGGPAEVRDTDNPSRSPSPLQDPNTQTEVFQSTEACNITTTRGLPAPESSSKDNPASDGQLPPLHLQDKPAPSASKAMPKQRREEVLPDEEIIRQYKLAIKEGWFEPHERKIIINYFKAVECNNNAEQVAECRSQLLTLPDVLNRYRPPPDHLLDYPTDGVGVQCDIIFSNPLAVHNSAMLRCYNLSDHRVKPMVLFVKAWARRRKINSPYHGTLSSYGYVLMVLHYLVNIARPPICLNLQTVPMATRDESAENALVIEGHGVRFWRNESEIQQWARTGRITLDHHSSVGSLLRGFFHYYAIQQGGFSWSMEVLSLRTPGGILTKNQKGWTAAKTEVLDPSKDGQRGQEVRQRYLFAIEDPFETNHNIARTVVHNGIVAIRDEFRRANRLVHEAGNGEITEDLLVEAASKNDLNYRHFGPRPRPQTSKDAEQDTKP
ncbi:MAG: hypothetical protein Q9170_005644 [Blastenia crenularia]